MIAELKATMETGKEDEVLPRTKPENKEQAISP